MTITGHYNSNFFWTLWPATLVTSLYKHCEKDIDVIYAFDLGLTKEEQHVLLNLKKVEFMPMIETLQYTTHTRTSFPVF